jgi:glucuronosyltransferase
MPGRDIGVYWVEHILHHGGKHLNSSSKNLPFYKLHLLDVWLFLMTILATTLFVIFRSLTWLVKKLRLGKLKTQ